MGKCNSRLKGCLGEADDGYKRCRFCRDYGDVVTKRHRSLNKEKTTCQSKASMRMGRQRARLEVIDILGGKCACCNEETYEFLTVDHIHKNGKAHRESLGLRRGVNSPFYIRLLRSRDFSGLQLLCANCHQAKDTFGGCPHQVGSSKDFIRQKIAEVEANKVKQQKAKTSVAFCECGCGVSFVRKDSHSRPRRFVQGHSARVIRPNKRSNANTRKKHTREGHPYDPPVHSEATG